MAPRTAPAHPARTPMALLAFLVALGVDAVLEVFFDAEGVRLGVVEAGAGVEIPAGADWEARGAVD